MRALRPIARRVRLAWRVLSHGAPMAWRALRHGEVPNMLTRSTSDPVSPMTSSLSPNPTTEVSINGVAMFYIGAGGVSRNGGPDRRIIVTGNCMMPGLAAALRLIFPRDSVQYHRIWVEDKASIAAALTDADIWVAQPVPDNEELLERSRTQARQVLCPPLVFSGFHPDMVYAWRGDGSFFQGLNPYHSAIALWAWRTGLDVPDALRLFKPEIFRRLGYYDTYRAEVDALRAAFAASKLDFSWFWLRVKRMGVFMNTVNHPRIEPIVLLAKLIAVELGVSSDVLNQPLERYVQDDLLPIAVWPVYPDLAAHLGVRGSYLFSFGPLTFSLDEFLETQWAAYGDADPDDIGCPRITTGLYDSVLEPFLVKSR
jgi:Polysaccharide biosynthesis enzyme WcbI